MVLSLHPSLHCTDVASASLQATFNHRFASYPLAQPYLLPSPEFLFPLIQLLAQHLPRNDAITNRHVYVIALRTQDHRNGVAKQNGYNIA